MNSTHSHRIQRILTKLRQARKLACKSFGSEEHGFKLARPLSEDVILAWEQARGVVLPEDYRAFLREAGASGAGPYYGLRPLDRWGELLSTGVDEHALSHPCLIELRSGLRGGIAGDATDGGVREPYQGAMPLIHMGCCGYVFLILTGPHRGRMVNVDTDEQFAPQFADYADFLSYYEAWLDEVLIGIDGGFGFARAGDESQLVARLQTADDPIEQAGFLEALGRFTSLGTEAQDAVLSALESPSAEVLAAALRSVTGGTVAVDPHRLRGMCSHGSVAVRRAAFSALAQREPDLALAVARSLVLDSDDELGRLCVHQLHDRSALDATMLQKIVEHGRSDVRRAALYWASATDPAVRRLQLKELSEVTDPHYATVLVQSLAKARGSDDVSAAFAELLRESHDAMVLANLTQYFMQVRHEPALEQLISLTSHDHPLVRERATSAVAYQRPAPTPSRRRTRGGSRRWRRKR